MKLPLLNTIRSTLACTLLVAFAASAHAQLTSGEQIPPALKDIKRATGVCKRDDTGAGNTPSAPDIVADLSCAISPAQLQAMQGKPNTALIDLRSNTEFQGFHIDGALNLTQADLHSKPYWKSKAVVLLGNGKAERELYGECTRLKQLGYKQVNVLRGGMPLWLAQKLPVQGSAPAAAQLQRLVANEFWLESRNHDNLILLSKEQASIAGELPFSTPLAQTTPEAIKAVIEKRRKESKNAALASVVLALPNATTDEQIDRLQQALAPTPLLVYVDSADNFKRQLAQQKAIWVAQARGPKQLGCGL